MIAWLEFKFTYFDPTVQHINYYATGTLHNNNGVYFSIFNFEFFVII